MRFRKRNGCPFRDLEPWFAPQQRCKSSPPVALTALPHRNALLDESSNALLGVPRFQITDHDLACIGVGLSEWQLGLPVKCLLADGKR